ncbi:hypothetical protein AMK59_1916, partial [Oryctes borbonicus]
YRHATCLDVFFMILGSIGAAVSGACMPVMMMYFGDVTGAIVQYGDCYFNFTSSNTTNATLEDEKLTEAITKFCIQACALGLVSFVCIYVSVLVFSFSAVRQVCFSYTLSCSNFS